jgi:hypothetical protein
MLEHGSWSVKDVARGGAILLVGLTASACAQVFGAAAGAAVGEAAGADAGRVAVEVVEAVLEEPDPAVVTSVYRARPSAAWEDDLRVTPSALRPEVFEASFFHGECPGVRLFGGADRAVFGPLDRGDGGMLGLLGVTTSHTAQGFRRPLGNVPLGGPTPAANLWAAGGTHGLVGAGCSTPGIPLFVLGPRTEAIVVR